VSDVSVVGTQQESDMSCVDTLTLQNTVETHCSASAVNSRPESRSAQPHSVPSPRQLCDSACLWVTVGNSDSDLIAHLPTIDASQPKTNIHGNSIVVQSVNTV